VRKPAPGSFSEEVLLFLAGARGELACAGDLGASAPRLGRRLRALRRERRDIVALFEGPAAGGRGRGLASAVLGRIRALVKAENQAVFDCYWRDLGGEGGA